MAKVTTVVCDYVGCRQLADQTCGICEADGCLKHLPVQIVLTFGTSAQVRDDAALQTDRRSSLDSVRICTACSFSIANAVTPTTGFVLGGDALEQMYASLVADLKEEIRAQDAAEALAKMKPSG